MALVVADRVLETSTTTGSGVLTLAGAVLGYVAASAVCANADTFYYSIVGVDANGNPDGSGWETGLGTWGTGNTLTRTTVNSSSNANAAVVWGAGTRRIAMALTSEMFRMLRLKKTGTAASCGNATLVAGTVTVSTTAVTVNSVIMLTRKTSTDGLFYSTSIQYTISAGVSFTITSDNAADTSTYSWMIIEGI